MPVVDLIASGLSSPFVSVLLLFRTGLGTVPTPPIKLSVVGHKVKTARTFLAGYKAFIVRLNGRIILHMLEQ